MADGVTEKVQTVPTRERPLELHGRVAIVTGAAKGMGGPICSALAEEGAAVVLAGRGVQRLDGVHDGLGAGVLERPRVHVRRPSPRRRRCRGR